MKKLYLFIVAIVLVLLFILGFYFLSGGGDFLSEDILEAIKPGMEEFCEYLEDNVKHSACATCIYSNEYVLVEDLSGNLPTRTNWYVFDETEDGYLVSVKAYIIYGRNTRMGSKQVDFVLDKEGIIIDKTFPEETCA